MRRINKLRQEVNRVFLGIFWHAKSETGQLVKGVIGEKLIHCRGAPPKQAFDHSKKKGGGYGSHLPFSWTVLKISYDKRHTHNYSEIFPMKLPLRSS